MPVRLENRLFFYHKILLGEKIRWENYRIYDTIGMQLCLVGLATGIEFLQFATLTEFSTSVLEAVLDTGLSPLPRDDWINMM